MSVFINRAGGGSGGGGSASNVTVDYIKGYVNAGNSSTVPLGANAVFTGTAMDITDFATINVNVYSDVAGAAVGAVKVEFSPDGANWDHSHSTTYSGGSGRGYIFNSEYRFARVVYTNGTVAQSAFRLQTILKPTRVQSSLFTLDQTVSGGMFAELVKANLTAKNPSGNYVSVDCTNGGNLKVSVEEFDAAVFGQDTMANSLPVAIASNQTAIPVTDNGGSLTVDGTVTANAGTGTFAVSAASLPLPTGAATEATLSSLNGKVTACNTGAVTISTALPAGTNNIGDVDVLTLPNVTLASQANPFTSAIPVSDNGGSLTIDGTVAATQSGNWSVRNQDGSGNALTSRSVGSARAQDVAIVDGSGNQITSFGGGTEYTEDVAAAADPIGKATILVRADTPAGITSANGDNVAQRGTNYGAAFVQVLNSTGSFVDSFGGGTQYADGASAATPTGNQINWNESGTQRAVTLSKALPVQPGTGSVFDVEGNVASDGVDSGNPVKIGAIAKAYGTTVTVGADDRTDLRANRLGVLQTIGGALNTQCVAADYSATAQTNTVLVATTSVIVITRLSVFLSYNTSVAPFIRIGLGGSTTPTTTNCIIDHENVVPGSIITIGDGSGIIAVGAAGEDLRITCGAATDGSWNVSVTYFEVAS